MSGHSTPWWGNFSPANSSPTDSKPYYESGYGYHGTYPSVQTPNYERDSRYNSSGHWSPSTDHRRWNNYSPSEAPSTPVRSIQNSPTGSGSPVVAASAEYSNSCHTVASREDCDTQPPVLEDRTRSRTPMVTVTGNHIHENGRPAQNYITYGPHGEAESTRVLLTQDEIRMIHGAIPMVQWHGGAGSPALSPQDEGNPIQEVSTINLS